MDKSDIYLKKIGDELHDLNVGIKNITEELKIMNDLRMHELRVPTERIKAIRDIK